MLWFFRSPGFMVGWGDYTEQKYQTQSNGQPLSIADATAAVLVMILLFVLPKEVHLLTNFIYYSIIEKNYCKYFLLLCLHFTNILVKLPLLEEQTIIS